MNDRKTEALLEVSKSLFTASEALRQALDTIDLENLLREGVEPVQEELIKSACVIFERMAQNIKHQNGIK